MRVDAERSSLTFVRPFLFDPEQVGLALQLVSTAKAAGRDGPMPVWERVPFPTADWLPHIADSLVSSDGSLAIAEGYRLHNDFVQSDGGLGGRAFEFVPKKKSAAPVPMELEEVRLILFRNGVGFLVQRWKPKSDDPAVWLDLQHYGRFADPKRGATLRRPNDPAVTSFAAIAAIALTTADFGEGKQVPIRDVFIAGRTLPYAVVFFEGADAAWPREKFLYKLRRLFHASQTHHPTAEQEAVAPPNFHPYLKDQWFFVSLEGGGFAAADAPADEFFRHALPGHLEAEYFLLFVFALQQRFTLMALSADVAKQWKSHPAEQSRRDLRGVFEGIRDRLFDFTARYQFVQVVQRENHHRVYQLWRETFQTKELYEEVCGEVREMSDYLQDRDKQAREDRVGRLTLLLTVLIGAPSLAIGFWNINIKDYTSTEGFSLWEAVGCIVIVAGILAAAFAVVWYVLRRR